MVLSLITACASINKSDMAGETAMSIAAVYNDTMLIRFLLSLRADCNQMNARGQTPMHLAAKYGHRYSIRVVRDAGAKLNIRAIQTNMKSMLPVHLSKHYGHIEVVKFLRVTRLLPYVTTRTKRERYSSRTPFIDIFGESSVCSLDVA